MRRSTVARQRVLRSLLFAPVMALSLLQQSNAATIAPPMLDITHQCDAISRHNVTAMSECVVAESEARADLLQHWDKLPDGDVDKCVKLGRKAKRQPYTVMQKCLASDIAQASAPASSNDGRK